ncbi:solute carrier family 35 member G1-like [Bolinopsis microptera]|uniref:solute carrier family 35 member G1-like n=1 Tax=Bolinopsis microptera TaxID=2820187 RepID=UPI003079DC7E
MDCGDGVALNSLSPIFVALFSRVLWKEKLSIFTPVALFIGLTGVVLVVKPTFLFGILVESQVKEFNPFMKLVPIAGGIIYGFAFSCMRKVGTKLHKPPDIDKCEKIIRFRKIRDIDQELFKGFGLCAALLLSNRGLAIEKSGPGVLIRNCDIVVAYAIQVVFFYSIPDVLSVCGALLERMLFHVRGKPLFITSTQAEIDKSTAANVSQMRDPQTDAERCARIKNGPAPLNLEVPKHEFITKI